MSLVFWNSGGEFLFTPSALTVKEVGSRQNFLAWYLPDLKANESTPPSMVGHWFAVPVPFTSRYVLLWISSNVSLFGTPSAPAPWKYRKMHQIVQMIINLSSIKCQSGHS